MATEVTERWNGWALIALLWLLLVLAAAACSDDCPTGELRCDDVCIEPASDALHCGACGTTCAVGETCRAGVCAAMCGTSEMACGTLCCPMDVGCDGEGTACATIDAGRDGGPADTYRPPPPCPTEVPIEGAACDARDQRCTYLECPSVGVTRADCQASGWVLAMLPCESYPCDFGSGGMATCTESQLCIARMGGALLVECVDNPCGSGPIEESCACSVCATTDTCQVDGLSVTCVAHCDPGPCA